MASGGGGNGLGRGAVHESVHVTRLADIRILTELAGEVAASGAERQHARARVEMIERLLLNRIDAKARRTSIGRQDHLVALAHSHEAEAALPLMQFAVPRADVALDPSVVDPVPLGGGVVFIHYCTVRPISGSLHLET